MEGNKLLTLLITVTIGIILTGSLLSPVISDATKTEDTFENKGYFYVEDPTEEISFVLADGNLTINGQTVNPPESTTYPDGISVVITENAIFRYYGDELRSRGGLIGYHSFTACDLTFNAGAVTGTYTTEGTDTTVSTTYTSLTIIYPEETSRIMCTPTPQYVNADTEISGAGVIATPSLSTKYWLGEFEGNITDGIVVKIYGQSTGTEATTVSPTNVAINYTEVNGFVDLYSIESITFDVTDGTNTDSITFKTYIVPTEVTADLEEPMDSASSSLLKVAPLLMIVALIVIVASYFARGRD